jgi:hypothetical protein
MVSPGSAIRHTGLECTSALNDKGEPAMLWAAIAAAKLFGEAAARLPCQVLNRLYVPKEVRRNLSVRVQVHQRARQLPALANRIGGTLNSATSPDERDVRLSSDRGV